jgi:hypothetical protein
MREPEPLSGIPYRNFVKKNMQPKANVPNLSAPKARPVVVDSKSMEGEGVMKANVFKHDRVRVDNVGKNE